MHKRIDQNRHNAQGLRQIVKHRIQARLVRFVFRQNPRRVLINIFVGPSDSYPDFFQRQIEFKFIHMGFHFMSRGSGDGF